MRAPRSDNDDFGRRRYEHSDVHARDVEDRVKRAGEAVNGPLDSLGFLNGFDRAVEERSALQGCRHAEPLSESLASLRRQAPRGTLPMPPNRDHSAQKLDITLSVRNSLRPVPVLTPPHHRCSRDPSLHLTVRQETMSHA
jgi:hypothetical protein